MDINKFINDIVQEIENTDGIDISDGYGEYDDDYQEKEMFDVILPNPFDIEDTWTTIQTFDSREEALKFAKFHFGADDQGNINIISSFFEEE